MQPPDGISSQPIVGIAARRAFPARTSRLTSAVADLVGDEVLMYASGESHFPEAAGIVTGWVMPETRKRKLYQDNALRFYAHVAVCGQFAHPTSPLLVRAGKVR
jgi:hypothetical protein